MRASPCRALESERDADVLSVILGVLVLLSVTITGCALFLLRGAKDLQDFHERRADAPLPRRRF